VVLHFFIPDDGPRGPKHVVNNRLDYVDCILDSLRVLFRAFSVIFAVISQLMHNIFTTLLLIIYAYMMMVHAGPKHVGVCN
jgi:hypothetical protein